MALTMSVSMMKGLGEHPKQSYNVGKNWVDQVTRVNSGKLERSEAEEATSTVSGVISAAFVAFPGCAFVFDTLDSLYSPPLDLRADFGGFTRA
jgi:hypothetical protein